MPLHPTYALSGPFLQRSCEGNYSCREFIDDKVISCLEDKFQSPLPNHLAELSPLAKKRTDLGIGKAVQLYGFISLLLLFIYLGGRLIGQLVYFLSRFLGTLDWCRHSAPPPPLCAVTHSDWEICLLLHECICADFIVLTRCIFSLRSTTVLLCTSCGHTSPTLFSAKITPCFTVS